MAQSNAISPFILSVSDQVEKGIADIKHRLRRRGGGTGHLPRAAQFSLIFSLILIRANYAHSHRPKPKKHNIKKTYFISASCQDYISQFHRLT